MTEALLVMTANVSAASASSTHGWLTGIITDGDLRRHIGLDFLKVTVDDVMTREPQRSARPLAIEAWIS